jgi:membrane protease YdiL (CAAX protease family)
VEPVSEPEIPAVRTIQPLDRVAAFVEVVLCSGFPTQILLIGLMMNAGMTMQTADGRLSPPFIFTLSLVDTVLVVGLVFFFLLAHRESPRAVLLGQKRVVREIFVGVALVPAVFMLVLLVLMVILTVAPQLHNVPRNPLEDMLQTRGNAMIFGVVVMIAGGVREEIQRGFIVHRFEGFLGGAMIGVLVYSLLFGLGHVEQGYDAAIATGTLGAIWGVTYVVRRSVVAPMVSHAAFNLAQLIKFVALR